MSTLHVTVGGSAAESLRIALARIGREEPVIELHDDLAIGPLRGIDEPGEPRTAFWENLLGGTQQDWSARLAAELDQLEALAAGDGQVVIWHAQSVADQLMLRRVAYHLRHVPQRLNEVRLSHEDLGINPFPRTDRATAAGMFPPEQFAAKLPEAAPISVLRISRLALEWQEAKQANAEVRYWIDNTFKNGLYTDLDTLVLEHASVEWHPAARTVGAVIAHANRGHLFVSDGFAFWRCRELVPAGRIELRGPAPHFDNLHAISLRAAPAPA